MNSSILITEFTDSDGVPHYGIHTDQGRMGNHDLRRNIKLLRSNVRVHGRIQHTQQTRQNLRVIPDDNQLI